MRVNAVHNNHESEGVSLVDHIFNVSGSAESRRNGKEISYVITKAPVVSVLLNCHELYHIVSQSFYPRDYVVCEFSVT